MARLGNKTRRATRTTGGMSPGGSQYAPTTRPGNRRGLPRKRQVNRAGQPDDHQNPTQSGYRTMRSPPGPFTPSGRLSDPQGVDRHSKGYLLQLILCNKTVRSACLHIIAGGAPVFTSQCDAELSPVTESPSQNHHRCDQKKHSPEQRGHLNQPIPGLHYTLYRANLPRHNVEHITPKDEVVASSSTPSRWRKRQPQQSPDRESNEPDTWSAAAGAQAQSRSEKTSP